MHKAASVAPTIIRQYGWPDLQPTKVACAYCGGISRTTLQRSGPAPVGKRGRTFYYSRASLDRWLTGGIEQTSRDPMPMRSSKPSADALDRLRAIRSGAR